MKSQHFCPRCKKAMAERYGKPQRTEISNEPIEYSPEYRRLVHDVLTAKARRELQERMDRTGRG